MAPGFVTGISSLLLSIFLLILFYFTGEGLSRIFVRKLPGAKNNHSWNTHFQHLSNGLICWLTLYAIWRTGFRTSLLPVPFLLLYIVAREAKDRLTTFKSTPWKALFIFLSLTLFCHWLFYVGQYYIPGNDQHFIGADIFFYGSAGEYLNWERQENVFMDWLQLDPATIEPYHYADIWINAMLQKLTGVHPMYAAVLIAYPLLITIFVSGLAGLLEQKLGTLRKIDFAFILMCCFLSGFILIKGGISDITFQYTLALAQIPKLLLPAIIILKLVLSVEPGKPGYTLSIATMGFILYMPMGPALFTALGIGFVIVKIRKVDYPWPDLKAILIVALSLAYYCLFYFLAGKQESLQPEGFSLSQVLKILAGGSAFSLLSMLPFIILFVITKLKYPVAFNKLTLQISFLILIAISGMLCWALIYPFTPEASQLFMNVFIPVCVILIVAMLCIVTRLEIPWLKWLAILLAVSSATIDLFSGINNEKAPRKDLNALQNFFNQYGEGLFVDWRNNDEFNDFFKKNTVVYQPLPFIYYLQHPYTSISLNTPELRADTTHIYTDHETLMLNKSPFKAFIKTQPGNLSLEEYAYLFIEKYRCRYISVSPRAKLPVRLSGLVKDSLQLSQGWKIYYTGKYSGY